MHTQATVTNDDHRFGHTRLMITMEILITTTMVMMMIMMMIMMLQIIITVMPISCHFQDRKSLLVTSHVNSVLRSVQTFNVYYDEERWTQIPASRTRTAVSASLSHEADHSTETPAHCVHSKVSTPFSAMILPTTNIIQLL